MKPTFSYTFPYNSIAPAIVEFTSTPQMDSEEIYLFDFGDGTLYNCRAGERIVRHTYKKPGLYLVKAIAVDRKTMSNPVPITIVGVVYQTRWERFIAWLKQLFKYT